jgi:hypothetical protein
VLRDSFSRRAISACDNISDWYNRRISAQVLHSDHSPIRRVLTFRPELTHRSRLTGRSSSREAVMRRQGWLDATQLTPGASIPARISPWASIPARIADTPRARATPATAGRRGSVAIWCAHWPYRSSGLRSSRLHQAAGWQWGWGWTRVPEHHTASCGLSSKRWEGSSSSQSSRDLLCRNPSAVPTSARNHRHRGVLPALWLGAQMALPSERDDPLYGQTTVSDATDGAPFTGGPAA